ncbi:MAG: DMT family transporter [Bacteroidetes bacterium]|nr:DMT family transporter [Bacteroidota bacterium]
MAKEIKLNRTLVTIISVLAMFFWGMSFVWSKIVFRYYSPVTTIFLRLLFSSAILLSVCYIFFRSERLKMKDLRLFIVSAFFSPFCYFLGESYGLLEVSSTIASVIIAMIPVFTPFFAYFTLKEKLTWFNFLGITVSFIGVIIMLLKKDLSLNASPLGVVLLFIAVFSALGYGISVKKLSLKYNPFVVVGYQNLIGAIFFLPLFLFMDLKTFLTVKPNQQLITSMAALVIFASSLAFILYTSSVRYIGISRANIYSNLIPVFTAIFSFYVLNEEFTAAKLVGMAVVITGVILAQIGKLREKTIDNEVIPFK